ncbi:G2/mitotic-specific cyclin, partial [Massospora cicadina]
MDHQSHPPLSFAAVRHYLAVNLLDRFLSVRLASRARVPYTALACLFIAVKFETRLHPPVEQFVKSSGLTLTKQDLMIYEEYVLKVLDFRLGYPNPFQFLGYASLGDGSFLQTRLMARYVMEQCLLSSTLVHCDGALLACAAMHIARKILGRGSWDDKMEHCTGCRREEVVLIAKHMIDFLLVGPTVDGSLEKYSSAEYLRVALIATEWIAKRRTLVDEMAKTKAKADDQAL